MNSNQSVPSDGNSWSNDNSTTAMSNIGPITSSFYRTSNIGPTKSSFIASWSDVFISVVQWMLFIFGSLGNFTIIAVLLWRRSKAQLVTQLFIGSLSLAGLALMLSSGWIQALFYVENNWRWGQLCCQVQYYIQTIALSISICTLAALSVERYLGISKPSSHSVMKVSWAVAIIAFIWLANAVIMCPMIWWSIVVVNKSTGLSNCLAINAPQQIRANFIAFARVAVYWIPLVISWICYIGIIFKTNSSLQKISGVNNTAGVSQSNAAAMSKVTMMCLTIATSLTLTTLPFTIDLYVVAYGDSATSMSATNMLAYMRTISMLNTCINPVVYGIMWRPIRTSLQTIYVEIRTCGRRLQFNGRVAVSDEPSATRMDFAPPTSSSFTARKSVRNKQSISTVK